MAKKHIISAKQTLDNLQLQKIQETPELSISYYKGPVENVVRINRKNDRYAVLICLVRGNKTLLKNTAGTNSVELASNRCILIYSHTVDLVCKKNDSTDNDVELFVIKINPVFLTEILPANEKLFSAFRNKLLIKEPAQLTASAILLSVKMKTILYDLLAAKYPVNLKNVQAVFLKAKLMELVALQLEDIIQNPNDRPVISKREEHIAQKAVEILDKASFKHDFTLIGIAGQIGTNETTLKYAFKKIFGTTVYKYFLESRMKKAELLLKQGAKIGDVYAFIGYSNVTHFSVAYKRHFGINPGKIYK